MSSTVSATSARSPRNGLNSTKAAKHVAPTASNTAISCQAVAWGKTRAARRIVPNSAAASTAAHATAGTCGASKAAHENPVARRTILDGLNDAAQQPDGTSYAVFGGFPVPVSGKTGTAERPPNGDQSWYVVLAPYPDPEIVTAVTVEQGGFGADTAAPIALQILSAHFDRKAKPVGGGSGNFE